MNNTFILLLKLSATLVLTTIAAISVKRAVDWLDKNILNNTCYFKI